MSTSYTDETVRAKLSALNDSQDSIVAVAQWIMFHRYEDPENLEKGEEYKTKRKYKQNINPVC